MLTTSDPIDAPLVLRISRTLGLWLGLIAAAVLPLAVEAADPDALVPVEVEDPRPLMGAADQLQERYGVVIHYEDPPYSYEGDLTLAQTKPSSGGISQGKSGKPVIIPAGTGLSMSLRYQHTGTLMLDLGAILPALAQAHDAAGQPGRFRVEQAGGHYSIVPDQVRQEKGIWTPVTPILDTAISPAVTTGTGAEVLESLAAAVNATGGNLKIAMAPANILQQTNVSLSGTGLPARDYLIQVIDSLPLPVAWRLLYDFNMKSYYLSLLPVRSRTASFVKFEPPAEPPPIGSGGGFGSNG